MGHLILFVDILGLIIGFAVVYQGFQLCRTYPFAAVRALVTYIATYNLVNMLTLIAQYLLRNIGSLRSDSMYVLIAVVMGTVAFTLTTIGEGMFAIVVWRLSGKERTPAWFVSVYSLICIAWLAAFSYGCFRFFHFSDKHFLLYVHDWILLSLVALDTLLPPLLLVNLRNVEPDRQKRIAQTLGLFLLAIGCMEILGRLLPSSWYQLVFMAIGLTMNLCFLLNLEKFTVAYYGPLGPSSDPDLSLDWICSEFHLSARERDIIHMILKGKSNKEIEQELFISPHTVKNHVYHIFQKAGIKSRGQLVSLILQKSSGPGDRN